MKYIVIYGYYDYDGLLEFSSLDDAKSFLKRKIGQYTTGNGFWFEIYKADRFKLVKKSY